MTAKRHVLLEPPPPPGTIGFGNFPRGLGFSVTKAWVQTTKANMLSPILSYESYTDEMKTKSPKKFNFINA